jgi:hypothetical protein
MRRRAYPSMEWMNDRYPLAGHEVHRVGYGTMQLPGPGVFGPPADHDAAIAVLRRARELGVDHFDTSAYYGPWVSNALLREALHPYAGMTIVSKVGGRRAPDGGWLAASTPPELRWGIDENLIGLGVERIDVMNLRLMEAGDPAFDEKLGTMADAVQAGKIGAIGLSNVTLAELDRAAELGVRSVLPAGLRQGRRSPDRRRDRRAARRHAGAGRARVAARARAERAPDRGDVERGAPRGERRGRPDRARGRGRGRARRDRVLLIASTLDNPRYVDLSGTRSNQTPEGRV